MATYTTSVDAQADAVSSGTTARFIITTGICEAEATASSKAPPTTGTCEASAVVSGAVQHVQPCVAAAVTSDSTTAMSRVASGTCQASAVAEGDTFYGVPSQARYELFVATDGAAFDFGTPDETFTTLPHTTTLTLATGTHELVLRQRNKWGFTSLNIDPVTIVVDAGGAGQPPAPSAPEYVAITQDAIA